MQTSIRNKNNNITITFLLMSLTITRTKWVHLLNAVFKQNKNLSTCIFYHFISAARIQTLKMFISKSWAVWRRRSASRNCCRTLGCACLVWAFLCSRLADQCSNQIIAKSISFIALPSCSTGTISPGTATKLQLQPPASGITRVEHEHSLYAFMFAK